MIHNFKEFSKLNEASRSKIEEVHGMFEDNSIIYKVTL
jgi:hypothetical protein